MMPQFAGDWRTLLAVGGLVIAALTGIGRLLLTVWRAAATVQKIHSTVEQNKRDILTIRMTTENHILHKLDDLEAQAAETGERLATVEARVEILVEGLPDD